MKLLSLHMRLLVCTSILTCLLLACTDSNYGDQGPSDHYDDSLSYEENEPDSLNLKRRPYPSKLVGSWIAVELNVGDMILTAKDMQAQGIEAPVRTFHYDYTMKFGESEEMPLIPFYYTDSIISSEDQGEEYIEKLTKDTLILLHAIDGEKSRYVYVRKD